MDAPRSTGSLVCVGLGMTLGSHLGPLARSHIEQSDVVFAGLSDGIVELWLQKMHHDVRSLQPYYHEGKSRMQTYRQMVEAILTETNRSWNYAHGIAKRMFGRLRVEWLHADELHKLVAALSIDQQRRRKGQ